MVGKMFLERSETHALGDRAKPKRANVESSKFILIPMLTRARSGQAEH